MDERTMAVLVLSTLLPGQSLTAPVAESPLSATCRSSRAIRAVPPKDPNADSLGLGPWYVNADRSIWVSARTDAWTTSGGGAKVPWIRPQGTRLEVTGRRLDDDAPPLEVTIPEGYVTAFQSSRIRVPTSGCWEITARSGTSFLTFVRKVR
jgi:hypothetical protein